MHSYPKGVSKRKRWLYRSVPPPWLLPILDTRQFGIRILQLAHPQAHGAMSHDAHLYRVLISGLAPV